MSARAEFEYVVRFADNALVLGQRLSAWVARAPIMEEDVAFGNIALDLFGQARMWLAYAGEIEGCGRDEDRLAFHREGSEFRNVLLVERPNGNFADTIVRSFFYDAWAHLAYGALSESGDRHIAAIAAKSQKESAYHLRRSRDWVIRLGDGTELSHGRVQKAADDLWRYTGELFIGDDVDTQMTQQGIGFAPHSLHDAWQHQVRETFNQATLHLPPDAYMQRGGKQGVHTEDLGYLLAEMQVLPRAHPEAVW